MKKIQIGEVDVDSGLVFVGDPCYIWNNEQRRADNDPPAIEREVGDYHAMCDSLDGVAYPQYKSYNGYGVITSSGYGDGTYPVYATIEDGHIVSLTIDFLPSDEDGDE